MVSFFLLSFFFFPALTHNFIDDTQNEIIANDRRELTYDELVHCHLRRGNSKNTSI